MSFKMVVTDLDNTLYGWVGYVVHAIEAMIESLAASTGEPFDEILASMQQVYARRGSIEYPFVIQECAIFAERSKDFDSFSKDVLIPARKAFARERRQYLKPYPGVVETLTELKRRGVPVVGLSDASAFSAMLRLRMLELDGLLDGLYAIEPYPLPPPDRIERQILDKLEAGMYRSERLDPVHLPVSAVKPSMHGLNLILERFGVSTKEIVIVGDNLTKDMGLAEAAGTLGLWAEYGTVFEPGVREKLDRYVPKNVQKRNAPDFEGHSALPHRPLESFAQVLQAVDQEWGAP